MVSSLRLMSAHNLKFDKLQRLLALTIVDLKLYLGFFSEKVGLFLEYYYGRELRSLDA